MGHIVYPTRGYSLLQQRLDRIFNTMRHIVGMDMVSEPLRLKSAAAANDCEIAREYGRLVAARLQS